MATAPSPTLAIVIAAVVLLISLLFGTIGRACAASRNRGRAGFWLGFLLGPLGCLLAIFLPAGAPRRFARRPSWR